MGAVMSPNNGLQCGEIYLPSGWARDIAIEFGAAGEIAAVRPAAPEDPFPKAAGPVLPGLPNLHSHAFQRALAGLTERAGPAGDDFWSWRQAVYRFVPKLAPEDVEAIAAQLYVDMLKGGYTSVGEFHYLHHDAQGAPYDDPAEMAHRISSASERAGIGLTLLPVLYAQGGFGGAPAEPGQKRYVSGEETYARLVESIAAGSDRQRRYRFGIAPHSLRAVGPEALARMIELIDGLDSSAPIHIHIAEQVREVEECVAWSGCRPVEWLLANADVGRRWCLVHATHMTAMETAGLAGSGAVAGLCPTTEADLGDGLFPAVEYVASGGVLGVGSDSHVVVDASEELRLLEFGQRLLERRRNLLRMAGRESTGAGLYDMALTGGTQALGQEVGRIENGARADLIVLDGDAPVLAGKRGDDTLDSYVFSGGRELVRDVYVAGKRVIESGRHAAENEIADTFAKAMRRLLAD
jgi:formimidoylglutamate deiminase